MMNNINDSNKRIHKIIHLKRTQTPLKMNTKRNTKKDESEKREDWFNVDISGTWKQYNLYDETQASCPSKSLFCTNCSFHMN